MNLKSNSWKMKIGWLLLFYVLSPRLSAQSPYALKPNTDYSLLAAGGISLMLGQIFENNAVVLTPYEIDKLDSKNISAFDRPAVNNYSEKAGTTSDILLVGAALAPLSLISEKSLREDWVTMGVMGIEVLTLSFGITNSFKASVLRSRPYVYNPAVSMEKKQKLDARYAFFSRHTALSSSMTFFSARVFSDLYPDSKWKPVVWTGAILLPAFTAWSSVKSGQHFNTDVMVGYAVGAVIGYFIPVIHLKKNEDKSQVTILPTNNGLALNWMF